MLQPDTGLRTTYLPPNQHLIFFIRGTLRYCIKEFMQENTHVHRRLVAEDLAGMFHALNAGR